MKYFGILVCLLFFISCQNSKVEKGNSNPNSSISFGQQSVNDAPEVVSQEFVVEAGVDREITIDATDKNGDDVYFKIEYQRSVGKFECNELQVNSMKCHYICDESRCLDGVVDTFKYYAFDKKSEIQEATISFKIKATNDSDGDQIPDYLEKSVNSNPYIADIPTVAGIQVHNAILETPGVGNISQEFKDYIDHGKYLSYFLRDDDAKFAEDREFDNIFEVTPWDKKLIYSYRANINDQRNILNGKKSKLIVNFDLAFNGMANIESIDGVKGDLYFVSKLGKKMIWSGDLKLDSSANVSSKNYNRIDGMIIPKIIIEIDKLDSSFVKTLLNDGSFFLKISDINYKIKNDDHIYSYDKIRNKLFKNSKQIFIVKDESVMPLFSNWPLNQVLSDVRFLSHVEDGKLVELFGKKNNEKNNEKWIIADNCYDKADRKCFVIFDSYYLNKKNEVIKANSGDSLNKVTGGSTVHLFGKINKTESYLKQENGILDVVMRYFLRNDISQRCIMPEVKIIEQGEISTNFGIVPFVHKLVRSNNVIEVLRERSTLPNNADIMELMVSLEGQNYALKNFSNVSISRFANGYFYISFEVSSKIFDYEFLSEINVTKNSLGFQRCFKRNVVVDSKLRDRGCSQYFENNIDKIVNQFVVANSSEVCKREQIFFNGAVVVD